MNTVHQNEQCLVRARLRGKPLQRARRCTYVLDARRINAREALLNGAPIRALP
jgi:hypothetical protein